jgi:hypothetical protein
MKDEHDKYTLELGSPMPAPRPAGARCQAGEAKTKPIPRRGNAYARTVQDDPLGLAKIPACATSDHPASVFNRTHYVPVSFVAKDWSVTPRRIRSLLAAQRLEGRRQENGYWEVVYPYHFIIGTRGPVLKRQQAPKRGRPKLAWSAE